MPGEGALEPSIVVFERTRSEDPQAIEPLTANLMWRFDEARQDRRDPAPESASVVTSQIGERSPATMSDPQPPVTSPEETGVGVGGTGVGGTGVGVGVEAETATEVDFSVVPPSPEQFSE
jgi:hypothetical protein